MTYLLIIIVVIIFFYFLKKRSTFGEMKSPSSEPEKEVYHLDTRNEFPTVPPVNPIMYNAVLINSLPVDKGLYSEQDPSSFGYTINENQNIESTNQLEY